MALAVGVKGVTALVGQSFCRLVKSSSLLGIEQLCLPEDRAQQLAFHISAGAKGNAAIGVCEEFRLAFIFCRALQIAEYAGWLLA